MALEIGSRSWVLLDFYESAYGPTLRIDIPTRALLEALKGIFLGLAQREKARVELTRIDFVRSESVNGLELVLLEGPKEPGRMKALHLSPDNQFVWKLYPDGWQSCLDLLEGFGEHAGHQYLTSGQTDDALVEAAFMERKAPSGGFSKSTA
jgi:hypothetical protein